MQMQFQDNVEYCFRIELNSLKIVLQHNSIGAKCSMRKETGRLALLGSNLRREAWIKISGEERRETRYLHVWEFNTWLRWCFKTGEKSYRIKDVD